ncbi:kinase-like protein [Macrolepiota fuliginosa MF-IS2]|uniref:Kinase-like protein n=1 Tax=Macrolepiota fuliginosa MF-IS2 TaxID=1400762 RepID=A0A9P5X891_9AGAR|nr:kinase-like protein [Macrolepiota fuliginosa MF-IS2]
MIAHQKLPLEGVRFTESNYFSFGGLADIYRGEWIPEPGGSPVRVAIKVPRIGPQNGNQAVERARKRILRESRVCSQLDHPNIVPLYGVFFNEQKYPCLVMPYYVDGDLIRYLNRTQARANILELMYEAASGLEYMHNLSPYPTIHGDIKGQNMLLDNGHVRVADFGTSKLLDIPLSTSSRMAGTFRWMSPELLRDEDPKPTTASDVWALGMTILQVFTGSNPYNHIKNDAAVIVGVMQGELPPQPPEIDGIMWTLLKRCFSYDPTKRPRMETVSIVLNIMISERLTPKAVNRFTARGNSTHLWLAGYT